MPITTITPGCLSCVESAAGSERRVPMAPGSTSRQEYAGSDGSRPPVGLDWDQIVSSRYDFGRFKKCLLSYHGLHDSVNGLTICSQNI